MLKILRLHSSPSKKKYEEQIPTSIKNNGGTIRTVMQIITVHVGQESLQCDHCQKEDFNVYAIKPDKRWYTRWPRHRTSNRGSPIIAKHIKSNRNCLPAYWQFYALNQQNQHFPS